MVYSVFIADSILVCIQNTVTSTDSYGVSVETNGVSVRVRQVITGRQVGAVVLSVTYVISVNIL